METHFFPLFVDLSKKKILVVGGGHVAQRRVQSLLPFARHIIVISPSVTKDLEKEFANSDTSDVLNTNNTLTTTYSSNTSGVPGASDVSGVPGSSAPQDRTNEQGLMSFSGASTSSGGNSARPLWLKRSFRDGDETGMDLVLACTDDPAVNRHITGLARAAGIPANNCSDRNDCDFLFPGLSTRDSVTVGITAGGNDHRLVRQIREQTDILLEKMIPPDKLG